LGAANPLRPIPAVNGDEITSHFLSFFSITTIIAELLSGVSLKTTSNWLILSNKIAFRFTIARALFSGVDRSFPVAGSFKVMATKH
jgi:hypothetical protein